ncbi:Na-K-Cl cotransporter [Algivirga pacifica]|uniref:Na-K-Cl cotransporter n=2 Tax=Algivirga pacifica TaxID=1162670 RepID=A0ABP9D0Z4_9BACT
MVMLGHLVTIPTALAVSEIATNQKVQGGGVYYIISRSFGVTIGGAIGLALYLSQAVSTAFYIIAFAESFKPVIQYLLVEHNIYIYDLRLISIPATFILIIIVIVKGADLGMQTLNIVAVVLFASLGMFFFGSTDYIPDPGGASIWNNPIVEGDDFFKVFAICFPAFTGMAAGVGLSGDLKDPSKSIPTGTMMATFAGMVVYLLVAYKLAVSASPEVLNEDPLIMQKIAVWGPAIPIGLAAAALSSAIGSILVAPRTMQALAFDKVFPSEGINRLLAIQLKGNNEPINASIVTSIITLVFVIIGDIDVVAQIITMFFMVTYGTICLISFLEHFASDPAYRPVFKSKWYISMVGALACLYLMFRIDAFYSIMSIAIMVITYYMISKFTQNKQGLSVIFQGVIFQLSRQFQIFLQKADKEAEEEHWRPSLVCISDSTFKRFAAFNMVKWIAHKYGFGTYIHHIPGYLSKDTHRQAEESLSRLIKISDATKSKVYLDTMISPSMTSAIAQVIQLPSIAGKENNMIMFEFSKHKLDGLKDIVDNFKLISVTDNDICVLGTDERNFGYKQEIHIWLTPKDYENANLMILIGFIILGHPEWSEASISIKAIYPENELEEQNANIKRLIATGRLPISKDRVTMIPQSENVEPKTIINKESVTADLTIIGIRPESIKKSNEQVFTGYDDIGDVLFIHTSNRKEIK